MQELWHILGPKLHPSELVADSLIKLIVAAILGAAIGLERQLNKSPAGLRTNMFRCVGTALFTILAIVLNIGPIAGQIVSGIGFIGAGSILHSKGGISGITTAATIFVVAAVGMAVGGSQYAIAIFTTILVLVGLHVLGRLETRFNLKPIAVHYEVKGSNAEGVMSALNNTLEEEFLIMDSVQFATSDGHYRVQFSVDAMHSVHQELVEKLRKRAGIDSVEVIHVPRYES
jgi:putative Mg2+ transporter-C (MgtC) family protein